MAKLEKYQSMRDFGVTAEPSGKTTLAPKSERLRFVIQKHAATRLHYDLRLEYEGVFKSWAVTRGPSLDPHERRLAVEVEDHPLDYGDFEGTIPKGQYGGGSVMLWDRGYWEPVGDYTIEQQLKKGHVNARFDGERMKGAWHLVRLDKDRNRSKRTNWLLIKAHDGAEHDGDADALLTQNDVSVASGRAMDDIAAGKGKGPKPFMKAGRKAAPADAVWQSNHDDADPPELAEPQAAPAKVKARPRHGKAASSLPRFVEPQLAKLVDRPPLGEGWAHEIKFDGYRLQLRVEAGKAALFTRKGLDWTAKFSEIAGDGAALADGIYDGEAVALDSHGKPDFAGLQAALSSGRTADLVFFLFDALYASADGKVEDLRDLPLADRKARLKQALDAAPSPRLRYVDHFETAGAAVLKSACSMELEGIVSKKLDAPYRSGRGETWVKAKCRGGQEVVIAGWTTTGDAFRSLIAGVYRDGRLIHIGRIGTGYGRDKVERLLPRLQALETDASPFEGPGAPRKAAGVHWVKPELAAEIEFAGWTGDGHIRQASFKGLREDKPARDIVAEAPEAEAAVDKDAKAQKPPAKLAPPAKESGSPVVRGINISNPAKPLWPAHEDQPPVTKLEMARYLDAVSDWMLPHIKGRPCSIIRTPDGIEGQQHFFQRHGGAGTSSLITLVTVSGDRKPYIQIDSVEALIAAAQSGATEYHPWNCEPGAPEVPGRLVFDLDPAPDVPFQAVIDGAKEVKARLEALGLVAFCKTTGGKGLHVVTPLKPGKLDWPTAKAFARELCERMAADSPGKYLVNMAKAKRTGKIFLDYLRNDRMSTAVAPLSPRARPGAPVSFPLTWSQVRAGLDPRRYTIRTAPALLADTKAWADYYESERPLDAAIKLFAKTRARAA